MKKKLVLAGCAHIHTPSFVKTLQAAGDSLEVAGCWDHEPSRAEENAKLLSCASVSSLDELLALPSDAVIVCSETNLHKEIVLKAVAAGKHLFVEKPLGFSTADADEMADAVEKAGVIFQTGYFMRGNPQIRFLKEQLEKGTFGTVTHARFSNCHSGSLGGWFDTKWRWMAEPSTAGCGAFGDLGTHVLDILMWFFGMPESVAADVRTVTGRYGASCDENGEALLTFPKGISASISSGWVNVSNPVFCEIHGTEASAAIFGNKLYFQAESLEGSTCDKPFEGTLPEALPHAFQLFLDAVGGKKVPLVTVREAAARNRAMEALYRSAKERSRVSL